VRKRGGIYSVGSDRKSQSQSMDKSREDENKSMFRNVVFCSKHYTMGKVHKPGNPEPGILGPVNLKTAINRVKNHNKILVPRRETFLI
jgi:hypothetical protein